MSRDTLPASFSALPRHPAVSDDLTWYLTAMEADGLSPATIRGYQESLDNLRRFVGDKPLLDLTVDDLRAYVVNLRRVYDRPNTQNRYWRDVRKFYRWSYTEGISDTDVTARIKGPKPASVTIIPLEQEHIQKLLWLCPPNTWWGARDGALITFLLTTGARSAELMGLDMSDVDLTRRVARLKGKGDHALAVKERLVPLTAKCLQALMHWYYHRGRILCVAPELKEAVWLSKVPHRQQWGRMTQMAQKMMFSRIKVRAGITDRRVSAHTFRHTFGCHMALAGMSLPHLQALMGHKSMASTLRYIQYAAQLAARQEMQEIDPFKNWV